MIYFYVFIICVFVKFESHQTYEHSLNIILKIPCIGFNNKNLSKKECKIIVLLLPFQLIPGIHI